MSKIFKDPKGLAGQLHNLTSWEVLLLNKMYETELFNSLDLVFHKDNVDFNDLRSMILRVLKDWKRDKYLEYLKIYHLSNLIDYKYSISRSINSYADTLLKNNIDFLLSKAGYLPDKIISNFLTEEVQKEIQQLESTMNTKDLFNPNDEYMTLMNLLNCLTYPKLFNYYYNIIRIIDHIKSDEKRYFLYKESEYLDVLVLSALGRCKIWSSISKDTKNSAKAIPKLWDWAQLMKTENKELDFQIHLSVQSKKHKIQTAKKYILKTANPELIEAVRRGRYSEVKRLLDNGASIESTDPSTIKNQGPLHIACLNGDLGMVKLLEKYGCDFESLDFEQMTPIYYAIQSENIEVIDYLVSKGVDLEHRECQDRTPFYWACCQCSPKIVDYLYRLGCKINVVSKLKRSPLSKAAYIGRADIVELLLSYEGIEIDQLDNRGRTPLHNAVWGKTGGREGKRVGSTQQEDCPEAAQLLLEKGAQVNLKDADGNTPLAIAAASHADRSIPILIAFGGELNVQNKLGETPLYQASKYGHIEICKLLLENYNPDPFIRSNQGIDSFGAAIYHKHPELTQYYIEKFNEKIINNEDYFEEIVKLSIDNFQGKDAEEIITRLFKVKKAPKEKFLSEQTVKAFIRSKNIKIVKCLFSYLELWKTLYPKELAHIVRVIVEEAIDLNWVECCRHALSIYTLEINQLAWSVSRFPALFLYLPDDFLFIIENFNIDLFATDKNGETLLHHLVKKRNTSLLLNLLNYLIQLIKEKKVALNINLKDIDFEKISKFIQAKNKQGNSALEYALIKKYYDVHNIITKFMGENLEVTIQLAKYKADILEKEPVRLHKQKEKLVEVITKLEDLAVETMEAKFDDSHLFFKRVNEAESSKIRETYEKFLSCNENDRAGFFEKLISQKPVKFIQEESDLAECAEDLKKYTLIGVDLEYHIEEDRTPKVGFVCLLQISTVDRDYMIDGIKLHSVIPKYLTEIFASENIVKCFHGCDSDLKWLKSDFDIDVVNLFDTAKAMMIIMNDKTAYSLSTVSCRYLNYALDKSFQQADWRVRPLPQGMMDYARLDSSVLLYLWWAMIKELTPNQAIHLAKKLVKKSWRTVEKSNLPRIAVISLS